MVQFIAVDWGTSRFRANLIDITGQVLRKVDTPCSIAKLSKEQQSDFIQQQTKELQNEAVNLQYMICGMPGSNVGMQEVEYLACPFDLKKLTEKLVTLDH